MPRPRNSMPEMKSHIRGQARVYLDGKYYYLGEYGTPEAQARFDTLVSEYLANGRKMPEDEPTHKGEQVITVGNVMAEYERLIDERPALEDYRHICKLVEYEYGDDPVSDFGPRKLGEIRDLFVISGIARPTVNKYVRQITLMFEHAVSRELIDVNVFIRLKTLKPLRKGQTTAPEYKKRKPAPIEDVQAAAGFLSPQVKAIITIMAKTAMRPSEVCRIRPMDIDRSGPVWFCRFEHHKTESHGVVKAVPIVDVAREALTPFLLRPDGDYCFSPAESAQWHRDQRTAQRTTPKSCGNRVGGTVPKENPKRAPGLLFTKNSLNRAVRRACEKAEVDRWTPYQLRHLAATAIADAMGIDGSRALLGHTGEAMTRRYVHQKQDEAKAIEAAMVAPSVG
jgi:integrase